MNALKGIFLTGLSHFSKILLGLFLVKLIATYLGANGLGQLGHFMSVVSIMLILAGGGIVNGVIKYSAEYRDASEELDGFVSSSFFYSFIFSIAYLVIGVACSFTLSKYIFGVEDLYWILILLFITQFGFAFNNLVIGLCGGFGKVKIIAIVQVIGNLSALPISWFLISKFDFVGAAISCFIAFLISVIPGAILFPSIFGYKRLKFSYSNAVKYFNLLYPFTLMLLVSALSLPLVEIIIRQAVISNYGYNDAGVWQAAIRLSSAYLGFFGVFLSYYFVPMISRINDVSVIKKKTLEYLILVGAVFSFGALTFYCWKEFFISLLLSSEFENLSTFLHYQLLGDLFKALSYVIGYVIVAKAAAKIYILAEIVQSLLFVIVVFFSIDYGLGMKGVYMSYFISMSLYFTICVSAFFFWAAKKENGNGF